MIIMMMITMAIRINNNNLYLVNATVYNNEEKRSENRQKIYEYNNSI